MVADRNTYKVIWWQSFHPCRLRGYVLSPDKLSVNFPEDYYESREVHFVFRVIRDEW